LLTHCENREYLDLIFFEMKKELNP